MILNTTTNRKDLNNSSFLYPINYSKKPKSNSFKYRQNPKNQKVKYHENNAKGLGKIPTHQLGEILSGF